MRRERFSLIDLLVLVGACLLLLGVGLPAVVVNAREYTYNIRCATNLKQIGQAILAYSKDNGAYPRTRADADPTSWTAYTQPHVANPFADDGPVPNDVTAAMFLLLRTQAITPDLFVCSVPRKIVPWDFGGGSRTAADCSNFPSGKFLGYSYANPYPSDAARKKGYKLNNSLSAEFAVIADMNPGTPQLLTTGFTASREEMNKVNSRNHFRGDGQNVLFGDGHAEYLQNPFVGVQRDNIYTFGKSGRDLGGAGIIGSPIDANDSLLLPVATVDPGSPKYPPGRAPMWPVYAFLVVTGFVVIGVVTLARRWLGRRRAASSAG